MSASQIDQENSSTATQREIVMFTTSWCGDCRRAKKVFAEQGVPYTEINIEDEPEAAEQVRRLNHGMQSVPTIVFPDGTILVEPSTPKLLDKFTSMAKDQ